MKSKRKTYCPISFGLSIFGDAWTLQILRDMIFKGKKQYKEFLDNEDAISTNILADRLKRLESEGIILKEQDPTSKKQFIYTPTKKGLDLLPILLEIIRWSAEYDSETGVPKEFIQRLKKNRSALESEIRINVHQKNRVH